MWDVLGLKADHAKCLECGTELKPERRRPGRKFRGRSAERRDVAVPIKAFRTSPPRPPRPAA